MSAIRSATVVLPVPGLPVNDMCSVGRLGRKAEVAAQLVDQQQGGDLADARLHGLEADQVAVELLQHLADAGLAVGRVEVDGGGGVGQAFGKGSHLTPPLGRGARPWA